MTYRKLICDIDAIMAHARSQGDVVAGLMLDRLKADVITAFRDDPETDQQFTDRIEALAGKPPNVCHSMEELRQRREKQRAEATK